MQRVAILISGGGSNMVRLVESMTGDHPARPVLVVSNDAAAAGLARASTLGVPTACADHHDFATRGDFETALLAVLNTASPDIVCLAGFMRILSPEFIDRYAGRILNIHPSLLPKYPGLHTHRRAIEAGDMQGGASVHLVTEELDGGPILGQAAVQILPGDTADRLAERVLVAEHRLYPAALRRFSAGDRNRHDLTAV